MKIIYCQELDPTYQAMLRDKVMQLLPNDPAWLCAKAGSRGGVDLVCYKDERRWERWYEYTIFNEQALALHLPSIQRAIAEWQEGQAARREGGSK